MLLLTDNIAESARLKQIFETVQTCTMLFAADAVRKSPVHSFIACHGGIRDEAGFETFAAALKHHRTRPNTPVLFVVDDEDEDFAAKAASLGVTESISATASDGDLITAARRCIRGLIASRYVVRGDDSTARNSIAAVGGVIAAVFDAAATRRAISPAYLARGATSLMTSIRTAKLSDWIDLVRRYDDATYQHCLLVAGLVAAFSARLGLTLEKQNILCQAALVHDVGKAQIPKAILCKPSALTSAEQALVRTHPAVGHEMIAKGGHDRVVLDVVLQHHEYIDGSGYPHRLARGQISEAVRVTTICDIYAALIERRPYKQPMSREDSRSILHGMSGKLDPSLLHAFDAVIAAT